MNILRRTIIAASMAAVCTMSLPPLHGSTVKFAAPSHAMFGKAKTIKFSLRNDTAIPIAVHAGDVVFAIDPGKTMKVSLPPGTRVTNDTATSRHTAGEVLVQVTDSISGATIAIT